MTVGRAQTYTHPVAIERMRDDKCPECGAGIDSHTGWGAPGCSLTDNGVAHRIAWQRHLDTLKDAK